MEENKPLLELVKALGKDKDAFLFEVESSVKAHVASQGKECLTIVERERNGAVYRKVKMEASLDYVNLLIKFCKGEYNNGRQLDSGLTDSIVEKVSNCYVRFYDTKSEQVANAFISTLLVNRTILHGFIRVLTEKMAREAGKQVRERMISLIIHQLKEAAASQTGHAITASVQNSAATATGVAVAKTLAILIVKLMSTHLKVLIIKFISMAAVHKIILVAIKKYVAAAIVAAIVKFIAAKLGISAGAAFAIVLLPIIGAFIAHEIRHFPKQLGEKIAGNVCEELEGRFNDINNTIVTSMFDEMFNTNPENLVSSIAENKDVQDMMGKLVRGLQSSPA